MKKSIVLGMLGLMTAAAPSFGSSYILLDNYYNHGPLIPYGVGIPADGASGPLGIPGTGLNGSWTVGLYYAPGILNISDPGGWWGGLPDPRLSLAAGIGSTAQLDSYLTDYTPGYFSSIPAFDTGLAAGSTITVEVIVYPTVSGSFANALYRGHSAPFTMPTGAPTDPNIPMVGDYMPAWIPEPAALALAGLGGLALLLLRRKKN